MVNAVPNTPQSNVSTSQNGVKKADPDIIISDTVGIAPDIIAPLLLENIGAQELSIISRHDLINGQSIIYKPIKNLSSLFEKYNPQNLVSLQNSSDTFFENFPIKLDAKIPETGTGPFGDTVYIEKDTNSLIINVTNMSPDERVEVEILVTGDLLDDTIYGEV